MTDITLLDGSIGQELVHRAGDRPTPLWSTTVMIDHPGLVRQVHGDYFATGATIASTNTYAVHRDRLDKHGMGDRFEALIDLALTEAEAARAADGSGRIAGSMGPLGASYRPDICPAPEIAAEFYAEIADLMGDRVDLYLVETAASVEQVQGALMGLLGRGKPAWIGVTVMDDDGTRLRSGELLTDLAPTLAQHRTDALLINCSRPEAVSQAMPLAATLGLPFGGYANGFTRITEGFLADSPTVEALSARRDLGPAEYADFAMAWAAAGATILGGCCEVGPAHIAELARRLIAQGHRIV